MRLRPVMAENRRNLPRASTYPLSGFVQLFLSCIFTTCPFFPATCTKTPQWIRDAPLWPVPKTRDLNVFGFALTVFLRERRVYNLRHNRCEPFLVTASTSMPAGETVVGAHPAKFSQAGGPTVPKSLKSSAHRNRSLRSVRAHGHPIAFLSHRPPCAHIVKVRFCPVCVSCEHQMSEHLGLADPAEAELLSHLYNGCLDCARCADES